MRSSQLPRPSKTREWHISKSSLGKREVLPWSGLFCSRLRQILFPPATHLTSQTRRQLKVLFPLRWTVKLRRPRPLGPLEFGERTHDNKTEFSFGYFSLRVFGFCLGFVEENPKKSSLPTAPVTPPRPPPLLQRQLSITNFCHTPPSLLLLHHWRSHSL